MNKTSGFIIAILVLFFLLSSIPTKSTLITTSALSYSDDSNGGGISPNTPFWDSSTQTFRYYDGSKIVPVSTQLVYRAVVRSGNDGFYFNTNSDGLYLFTFNGDSMIVSTSSYGVFNGRRAVSVINGNTGRASNGYLQLDNTASNPNVFVQGNGGNNVFSVYRLIQYQFGV